MARLMATPGFKITSMSFLGPLSRLNLCTAILVGLLGLRGTRIKLSQPSLLRSSHPHLAETFTLKEQLSTKKTCRIEWKNLSPSDCLCVCVWPWSWDLVSIYVTFNELCPPCYGHASTLMYLRFVRCMKKSARV